MRAARLIAETNPLSYNDRVRRLVTRVRSLPDPEADALVAEFAAGDRYSRELGLLVARHAGRYEGVVAYLDDSDVALRTIAASCVPTFAAFTPDAALQFCGTASARERDALITGVIRERRADLADALLRQEAGAHRVVSAARMLSVASTPVVEDLLDTLLPALPSAVAVARRHPSAFLAHARRDLENLPRDARSVWWRRRGGAVLAALSVGGRAKEILGLVARFAPREGWRPEHSGLLSALVREDADSAIRAILASPRLDIGGSARLRLSRGALRLIVENGAPSGIDYARSLIGWDHPGLTRLVLAAAPTFRPPFLAALVAAVGAVPELGPVLDAYLPDELRFADARERIARSEAAGISPYVDERRLPFAEAEPRLREMLASSFPGNRADGYRLLVEAAGYTRDPAVLATLLAGFDRLPNEQEPVRGAAISAIAALPMRMFADDQAVLLARIVDDAYDARDHSELSARAIRGLAVRLLASPTSTDLLRRFGVAALRRANGRFLLPSLSHLSVPVVDRIVDALLPVIDEHARVDRHDVLFILVQALGARAYGVGPLDARLAAAVRARQSSIAATAVRLWLADPRTRLRRVRQLIASDRSAVALPAVAAVVTGAANDLLDDAMLKGRVSGKFLGAAEVWLPPTTFARRWTGRQRAVAAKRLAAVAATSSIDVWVQSRAIALCAAIPGFERGPALRAASSDSVLLAELGLQMLGRSSPDAEAERALVAALGTDRARVAGPAVVRLAGFLRPAELQALLDAALSSSPKVTSRKALVAAVGRAGLSDPWPAFERVLGEKPHRDVVDAVVSAALRRLADPRALPFALERLPMDAVGASLVAGLEPGTVSASTRSDVAVRLADLCDSDALQSRQFAAAISGRWVAFSPTLRVGVWRMLSDVEVRPTAVPMAGALARSLLDSGHPEGLRDAVAILLDADSRSAADDEQRARRRITALLGQFVWHDDQPDDAAARRELLAVIDELAAVGDFAITAAQVALRLLATSEGEMDDEVTRLGRALAGRAAVAVTVLGGATDAGARLNRLAEAVPLLREAGEPEAVLAAGVVALLALRGPLNERWRHELAGLRASPFPEARERARRIVQN